MEFSKKPNFCFFLSVNHHLALKPIMKSSWSLKWKVGYMKPPLIASLFVPLVKSPCKCDETWITKSLVCIQTNVHMLFYCMCVRHCGVKGFGPFYSVLTSCTNVHAFCSISKTTTKQNARCDTLCDTLSILITDQ